MKSEVQQYKVIESEEEVNRELDCGTNSKDCGTSSPDKGNAITIYFISKLTLRSIRAVRNMIFRNLRNTLHISVVDFTLIECARGRENLTCTVLGGPRLGITNWIHTDICGIIRGPSKLGPLAS